MNIVIKLDGVDITDDVHITTARFKGCANGKVGDATLRLLDRTHDRQPGSIHSGQTLELFLDDTRVWDGYVMKVGRAYIFDVDDTSAPMATLRWWTIMGVDRNVLLQRRVMFHQEDPRKWSKEWPAGSTDREAILWMHENFLDLVDLDVDLTGHIDEIASPGPYEIFRLGSTGEPWGTIYEDCAKMTGAVYAIWPNDRAIHYHEDRNVTAPHILCNEPFNHGDDAVGYRECTNWRESMEMANEAWVWGAGRGSVNPVFAKYRDDDSVDAHGLWQWSDQWTGANQTRTVQKRAQSYVEGSNSHRRGHAEEIPTVELIVFDELIWAGLVAQFHQHQFDISEPLPVAEVTFSFPTPNVVKESIALSLEYDTPYGWIDPWHVEEDKPTGDNTGDPPPPIPVEGETIDEFDRVHYLIPDGYGWGTATNGSVWNTPVDSGFEDIFPMYVDGDFGNAVTVLVSDDGFPVTGTSTLAYSPPVPFAGFMRWMCQMNGFVDNDLGFRVVFFGLPGGGALLDLYVTPVDPAIENPGIADVIGYVWQDTTGDDFSLWRQTRINFDGVTWQTKTWLEDAGEPEAWDLEQSLEGISLPTDLSIFAQGLNRFTGANHGPTFMIDYIRSTETVAGDVTFTGQDVFGYGWTGHDDRYQTRWPYEPGSLEVTFQGISLRRGVDYFEVDPEQGLFRIAPDLPGGASSDNMEHLHIRYTPVGSKPTNAAPIGGHIGDVDSNHYRPARQMQLGWGTPFDGTNCAAAASAMLLDRHTLGALSPTSGSPLSIPPNIRYYSGNRALQGGLTSRDCMRAWAVGWGQTLSFPGYHSWNYFRQAIASGRAASFAGIYGVLPARLRFTRTGFNGPHSIYVNEELPDGNYLVFDPLTRKVLVYTPGELLAYGQAFTGIGGTVSASYCRKVG